MAQVPEGFPCINKDNLKDGKIQSERTYTAESLFGYMNGGAELYLEYGFERLVVSEIDIDGNEYKVEVYKMKDPEAAYGIYSVSVFRCDTTDLIGDYSCLTDYQLQVCKGQYYISIINNSGKQEAAEQSLEFTGKLMPMIRGESFILNDFIDDIPVSEDVEKTTLIKGELGLFNGAYDWYDIMRGEEGYVGLVLDKQDGSDVILKFKDDQAQSKFLEKLGIGSRPGIKEELNIDNNTVLAVISERVVVLHRVR